MARNARYVHTNLVARDWRALASFYQRVFHCEVVPPERHFAGSTLEAGTGVPGARLDGVHLRLPGHGTAGPTLEVFSYSEVAEGVPARVNRPGFGHIAFEVESVPEARDEVLREGGGTVGDVVTLSIKGGRDVTWCYLTDPEGNIVELQSWSRRPAPEHGMTEIAEFGLETHPGPYASWPSRSRLLHEGRDTGVKLCGYVVEAQFAVPAGFLIVTSQDCPYEELTDFYLLDPKFRIRGHACKGAPYTSWLLKAITPEPPDAFRVEFYGQGHWRLVMRERPWWSPRRRLSLTRGED